MKDVSPQKSTQNTVCLTTTSPFKSLDYWNNADNRIGMENRLINIAAKIVPGISEHIALKFNATPHTLYKWTFNYQGAAYGWAGRPDQFGNPDISEKTKIGNLFLTGHWTNMGSGITSVANSGYDTANLILLNERKL
jgi:prolycopene isomerase